MKPLVVIAQPPAARRRRLFAAWRGVEQQAAGVDDQRVADVLAAAQGRAVESYVASLLEEAVHPTAGAVTNPEKRNREGGKSLVEVCAMVRGLTDDVDFSRKPDTGRPLDLS